MPVINEKPLLSLSHLLILLCSQPSIHLELVDVLSLLPRHAAAARVKYFVGINLTDLSKMEDEKLNH